ncbi:MAG TPA: helix-turn-helix domain-containing protein [Polyangia bacterium]|nr:helix-turn-helix domain-containing protein [Polyangia bacterium]
MAKPSLQLAARPARRPAAPRREAAPEISVPRAADPAHADRHGWSRNRRAARLEVLKGGGDRLLSVSEVAEKLGLCTATIYGLCADGALPHIRILNTIRIASADLAAFIAARRAPGRRST